MSRSLHHTCFPGRYVGWTCELNPVDDPGLDVVCTAPLSDHPGGRCSDRLPGHPVARIVEADGTVATRRGPADYAHRYYRDRITEIQQRRTRTERHATRQVLGQLIGDVDNALARCDDLLERNLHVVHGPQPDVTHDVC